MTKHKQIIDYIKELVPGTKISVRKVASDLEVSEGTAYRAIKDAEKINIVTTVPRIGTVRIALPEKKEIAQLNYEEIVNVVEGNVLGGHSGLKQPLKKFVIGAMTVDEMEKYISPGDLLIVGNRVDAQLKALEKDCAVLISGGFHTSEEVINEADRIGLPIIVSSYDTFAIASLINKALSEKLVHKDVIQVEDIMMKDPEILRPSDTVGYWRERMRVTGHGRFPVVNEQGRIMGIITNKDVTGEGDQELISKLMTKNPITISPKATVAYASQLMVWEGVELIPIEENKSLVGVVSRQDVIKALQYMRNQPQIGETIESLLMTGFNVESTEMGIVAKGHISQFMVNYFGTVSCGSLSVLMLFIAGETARRHRHFEILTDSLSVYFVKPAQIKNELVLESRIIDSGRKNCKIEVEATSNKEIVAKAMISVKVNRKQASEGI